MHTTVSTALKAGAGAVSMTLTDRSSHVCGRATRCPRRPSWLTSRLLCHSRRGVELSDTDSYGEVARHLSVHRDRVEEVFRTLSYVDGVQLGALASAPAVLSVTLMDPVCPPSTVFAAFHAYGGPAEIDVHVFNGHERGQGQHQVRQLAWSAAALDPAEVPR